MVASLDPLAARDVLDRSAVFGALPDDARAELLGALKPESVPAGRVVVREHTVADHYYLIAAGEAEVWVTRGTGPVPTGDDWRPDSARHTLLARLGPGDGFGEMALLLGGLRRATVWAATDLALYTLDGATFTQVLDAHRGLAVGLEEEMALRSVAADLGRASPFAKLPPDALRWLAPRLCSAQYAPGEAIVREGEPG